MRSSNPLRPILIVPNPSDCHILLSSAAMRHRASPRTLTAQAKKADNESRKRRMDDSASPRRVRATRALDTSRSVTAAT